MSMRFVSKIFQPVLTIPKNAKIKNTEITCKSQKLLLECGLVRPTSSGLFTLLPLATRALDKLEALVSDSLEAVGGQKVSLPSLTAAGLWERSGRLKEVEGELLMVRDRHDKKYLLAPTHEEAIADLLSDIGTLSYKHLPLLLYQISRKYRDELRPKHGLLRSRQFSMLDAYSAHDGLESTLKLYATMQEVYRELFRKLRLPVYRVEADAGAMGGSLSHEWQLPAAAGEDVVAACERCGEQGEGGACKQCGGEMRDVNTIEVGHTFILGTKYSEALSATYAPATGPVRPIHMACYGIGLTRLLAASLEHLSSEASLRWPLPIAPYKVIVIGPKEGSREWSYHGWDRVLEVSGHVSSAVPGGDIVLDDRHNLTIGKRLVAADKMGYPYIIVCGKSSTETPPKYELYTSEPNVKENKLILTLDEIIRQIGDDTRVKEIAINTAAYVCVLFTSQINVLKTLVDLE